MPAALRLATAFMLMTGPVHALPFADADMAHGKALHDEHCAACHMQKFDGVEGEVIYTRDNRRVRSASGLSQQLTACTTMLSLPLFPEDEHDIAGYLNQHYYRFE